MGCVATIDGSCRPADGNQPSAEEQKAAYEEVNAQIMDLLPGVPLAHPVPSLAFKPEIQGYPASPVQDEVYNVITIED